MKKQKGITLIALIITIIVMLILVGVSVSTAINTGLFRTASEVATNTEVEKRNEVKISEGQANLDGTYTDIKGYVDELTTGLPQKLKVGDLIEYIPQAGQTYDASVLYAGCSGIFETDMDSNTEWKVIGIEGNTIKIIPKEASSAALTLNFWEGDANIIDALNDICEAIYGNTESDEYMATAKSLTAEDINNISKYKEVKNWIPTGSEVWLAETYYDPGTYDLYIYYVDGNGSVCSECLGGYTDTSGRSAEKKVRPLVSLTLKNGVSLVEDETKSTESETYWKF